MPINLSGITTGLLGYTLKKELLGDSLFWREIQIFDYELISLNLTGGNFNSSTIHSHITDDFKNRFSGDISVKVFQTQGDYFFPNDSLRSLKYNVQVEVKSSPISIGQIQSELSGAFYTGVTPSFFIQYASGINDFKEEFTLERSEAGNKSFIHNLSFGLSTGTRSDAAKIASGIFAVDHNTNLGIVGVSGGVSLADTGIFRDYFSEVFDTFKNTYSFSKRRDILSITGTQSTVPYSYSLKHKIELKEDGIIDVTENGTVQGYMTFNQSKNGCNTLLLESFARCNNVYNEYKDFVGGTSITSSLISGAKRTFINYNQIGMTTEYDILFTNDIRFSNSGVTTEEVLDFSADEKNLVEAKHNFSYSWNINSPPAGNIIYTLSGVNISSPKTVSGYYVNSQFYNASFPIKNISSYFSLPMKKNKASASFNYSTHPRFFVTLNGIYFYILDTKIQNTKPVDIITEYKVTNRPSKLSVINYAYQTEKGQIQITLEGGIGRRANEFFSFRNNVAPHLTVLYKYGIELFMKQFTSIIPIAFTYQLIDLKYNLTSDGNLQLTIIVDYTLKQYTS